MIMLSRYQSSKLNSTVQLFVLSKSVSRNFCSQLNQRKTLLSALKELKRQKNLKYGEISKNLSCNKVWLASVFEGQHPCDPDFSKKIAKLLEYDGNDLHLLSSIPIRGGGDHRNDPVVYRFNELIEVYGSSLKAIIQEEFGDGIMSAIDCQIELKKKVTSNGSRVIVKLDGKFLPYYNGRSADSL